MATATDLISDDIYVGIEEVVVLLLSKVELFFKHGRSKMSRIEKLDNLGILICNILEIA